MVQCECIMDAICYLLRKLRRWNSNSPLVEEILKGMFDELFGDNWLTFLMSFLRNRLGLSFPTSDFTSFKSALLLLDHGSIRTRLISTCHSLCYPPPPSKLSYYNMLDLSNAPNWVCFSSAASHYRLSRLFISNCFRFSRLLDPWDRN